MTSSCRSFTFPHSIQSWSIIFQKVWNLFCTLPSTVPPEDVRGMGIHLSRLTHVSSDFTEHKSLHHENQGRVIPQWAQQLPVAQRRLSSDSLSGEGEVVEGTAAENRLSPGLDKDGHYFIPSQIDECVLRELPSDIVEAVQRHRGVAGSDISPSPLTGRKRKPLSGNTTGDCEARRELGLRDLPPPDISMPMSQGGDYLIPSQVDPAVLAELPEHIQEAAAKRSRRSNKITNMTDLFEAAPCPVSLDKSRQRSVPHVSRRISTLPPTHNKRLSAAPPAPVSKISRRITGGPDGVLQATGSIQLDTPSTHLTTSPPASPFSLTQQVCSHVIKSMSEISAVNILPAPSVSRWTS